MRAGGRHDASDSDLTTLRSRIVKEFKNRTVQYAVTSLYGHQADANRLLRLWRDHRAIEIEC